MRYRSKPTEVEAVQWTGKNFLEVEALAGPKVRLTERYLSIPGHLELQAGKDGAQEWVPVPVRHWLVHQSGDVSDIWPVDHDYFESKYEPA